MMTMSKQAACEEMIDRRKLDIKWFGEQIEVLREEIKILNDMIDQEDYQLSVEAVERRIAFEEEKYGSIY